MEKTCSLMRSYVVIKITLASLRGVMIGWGRLERKATDNTEGLIVLPHPRCNLIMRCLKFERLGSSHTIKVVTRIIAATYRNLEEVRKGCFREDLWYRLNVLPITTPPLRDRLDDIPLLVDFYVKKIANRLGKNHRNHSHRSNTCATGLPLAGEYPGTGRRP